MANQDPSWSGIGNDEVITYNDLQKYIDAGGIVPKGTQNLNTLYGNRAVAYDTKLDNAVYYDIANTGTRLERGDLVTKKDILVKKPTYQVQYCIKDYHSWTGLDFYDKANENYYNNDSYIYTTGDKIVVAVLLRNIGQAPTMANTYVRMYYPAGVSYVSKSTVRISESNVTVFQQTSEFIEFEISESIPVDQYQISYALCVVFEHASPFDRTLPYNLNFTTNITSKYVTNSPLSFSRDTKWKYPVFDIAFTTNYGVYTIENPSQGQIPLNTTFEYIMDVRSTNEAHAHGFSLRLDYPSGVTYVGVSEAPSGWTTGMTHNTTSRVIILNAPTSNELYPPNYYRVKIQFTSNSCKTYIQATSRAYSTNSLSIASKTIENYIQAGDIKDLVYQGYDHCKSGGCESFYVYRDMGVCSSTYLRYFLVRKSDSNYRIDVGTTAPTNTGSCNTAPIYDIYVGVMCHNCTNVVVYRNSNSCYAGAYTYANSAGQTYTYNPATGQSCNYNANYSELLGSYCPAGQCSNYEVYKNTNPCFTGNQFYSSYNGGTTFATQPSLGFCNNTPNYSTYLGQTCFTGDCYPKNVYMNSQPCFFGNQYYIPETTLTYATNPMTTGAPCRTTPDIQYVNYSTCYECTIYSVFKDLNPCSSTYNHYFVNGNDVGTTAPPSGACNTSRTLTYQGYTTCVNCFNRNVYKDTNPCSSTFNHYFYDYGGGYQDVGTSAPSNAYCSCTCYDSLISNYDGFDYAFYSYYTCSGNYVEGYAMAGESFYVCYDSSQPSNFGSMNVDFQGYCS